MSLPFLVSEELGIDEVFRDCLGEFVRVLFRHFIIPLLHLLSPALRPPFFPPNRPRRIRMPYVAFTYPEREKVFTPPPLRRDENFLLEGTLTCLSTK